MKNIHEKIYHKHLINNYNNVNNFIKDTTKFYYWLALLVKEKVLEHKVYASDAFYIYLVSC